MNKKEVSGTAQEITGKVEKEVGKATGDKEAQAHGEAEEMKGKTKKQIGHLEGKLKDVQKDIVDAIHRARK